MLKPLLRASTAQPQAQVQVPLSGLITAQTRAEPLRVLGILNHQPFDQPRYPIGFAIQLYVGLVLKCDKALQRANCDFLATAQVNIHRKGIQACTLTLRQYLSRTEPCKVQRRMLLRGAGIALRQFLGNQCLDPWWFDWRWHWIVKNREHRFINRCFQEPLVIGPGIEIQVCMQQRLADVKQHVDNRLRKGFLIALLKLQQP